MKINKLIIAALMAEIGIFETDFLKETVQALVLENKIVPELFSSLNLKEEKTKKINLKLIERVTQSIERDLAMGRHLTTPLDSDYPSLLKLIEEPPLLLRYEGTPVWNSMPGIAIVGSREVSELSLLWMNLELKNFLQNQVCFVCSGGARGVDQRAHLLAIQSGRPTVAIIPSGLDQIYPPNLASLKGIILDQGGAFVSEYSSETSIKKYFFQQRNRLIAGISEVCLIIQSRIKSGTLLTAREAIEQGKPLWVLPGHPLDLAMNGNNLLLNEGATPILGAQDLDILFHAESGYFSKNKTLNRDI